MSWVERREGHLGEEIGYGWWDLGVGGWQLVSRFAGQGERRRAQKLEGHLRVTEQIRQYQHSEKAERLKGWKARTVGRLEGTDTKKGFVVWKRCGLRRGAFRSPSAKHRERSRSVEVALKKGSHRSKKIECFTVT
mgnify:CR=1 FL=1